MHFFLLLREKFRGPLRFLMSPLLCTKTVVLWFDVYSVHTTHLTGWINRTWLPTTISLPFWSFRGWVTPISWSIRRWDTRVLVIVTIRWWRIEVYWRWGWLHDILISRIIVYGVLIIRLFMIFNRVSIRRSTNLHRRYYGTERSFYGWYYQLYVVYMLEDHVRTSFSCGYYDCFQRKYV